MGTGSWNNDDYSTYSKSMGRDVTSGGALKSSYSHKELFSSVSIQPELDPKGVIRECCDSSEHPNTIPVILALDVTGSMGPTAAEVAKKLNPIMSGLYDRVADVEFLIMAIGDIMCDSAPLQVSQYESDIRIAKQLDKIYFEGGGGGNGSESYSLAWYFGLNHTRLDCWKRGKKGIIITIGDEPLNPHLPRKRLSQVTGDSPEADIDTGELYSAAINRFDIYHLAVDDLGTDYYFHSSQIQRTFGKYLDEKHLRVVNLENLSNAIVNIVTGSVGYTTQEDMVQDTNSFVDGISW